MLVEEFALLPKLVILRGGTLTKVNIGRRRAGRRRIVSDGSNSSHGWS